jgi:hypothetical protein
MMKILRMVSVFALLVCFCSCAGSQQRGATEQQAKPAVEAEKQEYPNVSKLEGVTIETVRKEPKLTSAYDNIVLAPLQANPQFFLDYPDLSIQFQVGVLSQLKGAKIFKRVESVESKDALAGFHGDTLIVEVKVIDMRIVSTGARIWVGAFAGSSFMNIYIKLTNASTQNVVLEIILTTQNNAFASAWAMGTENSLPMDMGKIVGEYLATIVPTK